MNQHFYLDFERPLAEMEGKIEEIKAYASSEGMDMSDEVQKLEDKAQKKQTPKANEKTPLLIVN